jgi:hypothetical protein
VDVAVSEWASGLLWGFGGPAHVACMDLYEAGAGAEGAQLVVTWRR